jgi:hypothetical protein
LENFLSKGCNHADETLPSGGFGADALLLAFTYQFSAGNGLKFE